MKTISLCLISALLLLLVSCSCKDNLTSRDEAIKMANNSQEAHNYQQCVKFGGLIAQSFPPQCYYNGKMFRRQLTEEELKMYPELSNPSDQEQVTTFPIEPVLENCIDKCGDGICQEVVCLGTNCPCTESMKLCPKDCENGSLLPSVN